MRWLLLLVLSSACVRTEPASAPPPATAKTAPSPSPKVEPAKPSVAELQRRAIAAMSAGFMAHDAKAIAAVYAPDARVRSPSATGFEEEQGRAAIEAGHTALFTKVPDLKIATVRVLQGADVVVWEWVFAGSTGPTARMGVRAASVLWFGEDGLVRVDHTYFDRPTIAGQLGGLAKVRPVETLPSDAGPWIDAPSSAERIDLVKALFATYAKKDEKGFLARVDDKTLREDLTDPSATTGGVGPNLRDFRALVKAYPDATVTVDSTLSAGDFVAVETTTTGTHGKTKKPLALHRLEILDVRFGKVMGWTVYGNGGENPTP